MLVEAVSYYASQGRENDFREALRFHIVAVKVILEVYRSTAKAKKFR